MVRLARAFGWTVDDMRRLTPQELAGILKALSEQEADAEYVISHRFAFLASMIAQPYSKDQLSADKFIGRPPWEQRKAEREQATRDDGDLAPLIAAAKAIGLRGPW